MKWFADISGKSFEVSSPVSRKMKDFRTGEVKNDASGAPLWTVGLAVKDASGIELINVTVAGNEPKLTVGQQVSVGRLEIGAYAIESNNGRPRSGLWFRAEAITPMGGSSSKAA
jgi:hypothetical protein